MRKQVCPDSLCTTRSRHSPSGRAQGNKPISARPVEMNYDQGPHEGGEAEHTAALVPVTAHDRVAAAFGKLSDALREFASIDPDALPDAQMCYLLLRSKDVSRDDLSAASRILSLVHAMLPSFKIDFTADKDTRVEQIKAFLRKDARVSIGTLRRNSNYKSLIAALSNEEVPGLQMVSDIMDRSFRGRSPNYVLNAFHLNEERILFASADGRSSDEIWRDPETPPSDKLRHTDHLSKLYELLRDPIGAFPKAPDRHDFMPTIVYCKKLPGPGNERKWFSEGKMIDPETFSIVGHENDPKPFHAIMQTDHWTKVINNDLEGFLKPLAAKGDEKAQLENVVYYYVVDHPCVPQHWTAKSRLQGYVGKATNMCIRGPQTGSSRWLQHLDKARAVYSSVLSNVDNKTMALVAGRGSQLVQETLAIMRALKPDGTKPGGIVFVIGKFGSITKAEKMESRILNEGSLNLKKFHLNGKLEKEDLSVEDESQAPQSQAL
ncbi:hypothetical protein DFJ74DRAFT_690449 [Hyaloraphidium curvatum]|nr:hypothetical protein DFJ74DRAFT_690449 [Hyaloraphidium curvatum]